MVMALDCLPLSGQRRRVCAASCPAPFLHHQRTLALKGRPRNKLAWPLVSFIRGNNHSAVLDFSGMSRQPRQPNEQLSEAETIRRRDAAVRRALTMPPKPYKDGKAGKLSPRRSPPATKR